MIASKTVNEYKSNQRKLRQLYLEEKAARAALIQLSRPNPVKREPLEQAEVLKIAKTNQKKQAKKSETQAQSKRKRQKGRQQQSSHVRSKIQSSSPETKSTTIKIEETRTHVL